MKLLKKDVRASFNMNSSYENSCYENSVSRLCGKALQSDEIQTSKFSNHLQVPSKELFKVSNGNGNCNNKCESISTPVKSKHLANPFKCTLSPIGNWEFQHFSKAVSGRENTKCFEPIKLTATQKNAMSVNVESPLVTEQGKSKTDLTAVSPLSLALKNIKAKRSRKNVCFDTKVISQDSKSPYESQTEKSDRVIPLQPGKWRKSLNLWRRTHSMPSDNTFNPKNVHDEGLRRDGHANKQKISLTTTVAGQRKSTLNRAHSSLGALKNSFKRQLLQRCRQNSIVPFDEAYNTHYLKSCCKIGEGAFGEVFLHTKPDARDTDKTVLKIIPIEGKELINGEIQKSFEQILQEVVISMELCALKDKHSERSFASGFANLERVSCVKGKYPVHLQKLWEEYDDRKESENDHPECFTASQQYIVLEMTFSGEDLEKFVFRNAEQSFYALHQIIYALAVGEDIYQFEHRDLHWGNVLVLSTEHKYITYKLNGNIITLPTKGVQITIIDYTLSRITYDDCSYYNDLSNDAELFTATGDYQFDIYRMMREILNNKWDIFKPKTNIFWISYIISKMLNGVTYKNIRSKLHLQYMKKLKNLQSTILTYESCMDSARDLCSKL